MPHVDQMTEMFASVRSSPARSTPLETNAEPDRTPELPGDVATAHHAHHLAPDLLLEHRPPRHQTEAEPVVDHGKAPAGELGGADKLAADRLSLADGLEGQAAFGGELATDALDLLTRQRAKEVGLDPQLALGRPTGVPLPDQLFGTPLEGFAHLGAEPSCRQRAAVAAHDLAVEPGCAVAGHLAFEVVGAEDAHLGPASLSGLVRARSGLKVLRDEPVVGIGPLDDAGAAKGLQPPDVRADVSVIVSTGNTDAAALGKCPMLARTVHARAPGNLGDVAIGRTLRLGAPDLDDAADRYLLGGRWVRE